MKKRILILLMCLCILGAVVLLCVISQTHYDREIRQDELELLRNHLKQYQTTVDTDTSSEKLPVDVETEETIPEETQTEPPDIETSVPETEPVKEPKATLDFQAMWETNPDICAWIEIKGTKVDYPVLQNPDDDNKYLNTAVDGHYYAGGSVFTQATYNRKDFNDPVTVIYGHRMRAGTMFGQLQPIYSSSQGFLEYNEIKIYLPNEVRYYTVFAAVPYSKTHILDAYDFTNDYWYENFFDGVMDIRDFGAQFNKERFPEPGDRVIILSTCLNGDSTKRYLVMAIYQEDIE